MPSPPPFRLHQVLLGVLLMILCSDSQAGDLLRLAREPALVRQAGTEQYRFTYSPTFSNPLIVRVTKTGDKITLRAVQFGGAGGYDPGRVTTDRTIAITPQEWQRVTLLADKSLFWTLPADDDTVGNDGTSWLIEGARADAQNVVSRWTPTYNTKERKLELFILFGRYLTSLSGLKIVIH